MKSPIKKSIIEALRARCRSVKDLKDIVNKKYPELSSDAVRKRVSRYLKELVKLGLVEERDGEYCWYIYINDLKDREDYDVKLNHSREMIPALRQIAGITLARDTFGPDEYIDENLRYLEKGAEDHLMSGYPDVWNLLTDYREEKEKVKHRRNLFYSALMEKMRKKFEKETILEPGKEGRHQSFIGNNIPSLIRSRIQYGSPSRLHLDDDRIWLDKIMVAKGKHLFTDIEDFVERETEDEINIIMVKQIEKIRNKATEIGSELEQEIGKLILRIKSGGPLLGGCEICPIYFSKTKKK